MTFKALLGQLRKQHYPPTVRAFAQTLGVDESRISRGTPFDIRGCLHLAQITGADPGTVLRAAGKGDIALTIEQLYGPARTSLRADERALLDAYNGIEGAALRYAVLYTTQSLAGQVTDVPVPEAPPLLREVPARRARR